MQSQQTGITGSCTDKINASELLGNNICTFAEQFKRLCKGAHKRNRLAANAGPAKPGALNCSQPELNLRIIACKADSIHSDKFMYILWLGILIVACSGIRNVADKRQAPGAPLRRRSNI